MARNISLNFRVVEGRDLPAKDVSGNSDPYCIVKVDHEVVARTATVWRNLNPFWGEEYTLHLPLDFHHLAFYVLDEDTIGHDDIIGKISLSKETIAAASPRGIDSWLNLSHVDPDEEVQGEIHLDVKLLAEAQGPRLRCHIIEARDLAPRDLSGTSDPFARIFWGSQSLETVTIKKTRFPHWDEVLELHGEEGPLRVEVWDWDMVGKNDFLGMVEFPPDVLLQCPPSGWFRLLPFASAEDDAGGKLGALRLKVRLAEERILPSVYYQPLIELLVESVMSPAQDDAMTPLALLDEVSSGESRQDIATQLVKIFLGRGLAVPLLDYLNLREVSRTTDPNTLFRSNSLASKSMEQFMKLVGIPYLHEVLKPCVNRIFEEKKYIELDPCKIELTRTRRISFKGTLSEEHVRENSLGLLIGYLGEILEAIVGSVDRCPPAMRAAFRQLHQRVEDRFPETEHEAVQSIGNLGQQLGRGKEQWMVPLHPFLLQSIIQVKAFLDKLVDIDAEGALEAQPRLLFPPSAVIKEGYLHLRKAEAGALVPRFAFKKRYFCLSSETFSYSKAPEWQVRTSIPVCRICAVERVDENAFQQPHMMQVITKTRDGQLDTMYIQCKNVNELNQWLSAIRKASVCNEGMLPSCHPGAFRGNRWTCCLQQDRTVQGCSRTHSAVTLGDWSDPLDPDAEAQMVYRQLLLGRDKLRKKYIEFSKDEIKLEQEVTQGQSGPGGEGSAVPEQERPPTAAAAAHLLAVIEDLEQAHKTFEQQEKEQPARGSLRS
ncbi:rasGAP-activating-like protein 1 isoform X2 [Vombatus ursinus]|uniref:RAS protein activator like 1 n=1 Tax=Vombatus ursinus TaxID=29139 RepID=A0A4X2K9K1_VOMUR|nr:rasGAP-activating-like protein 1 isoform X2 [Vombatus ursinus]